jgi:hypothetical protein
MKELLDSGNQSGEKGLVGEEFKEVAEEGDESHGRIVLPAQVHCRVTSIGGDKNLTLYALQNQVSYLSSFSTFC